ncbi:MAG: asparagine synthase (glutamine-hydrolyzing) [Rhodospirillales bacterium]|jgi:asparagine synthase (glutamine-hydrolysing)|nr:asparagine synthase (glutamine-hydrolyzing) [Rhodospirillales bacterium]
MCGIAGLMTATGQVPDERILKILADALEHRGPDGRGTHVAGSVGLVQTRLAIIDLETGDQPLFAQNAALVANGEIYNFVELRAKMGEVGFKTKSDCEPPLHLYLQHGAAYTRHLRGMYSIAIHDPDHDHLVLSRDPFGIKPIYYVQNEKGFAFASEPQALIAAGLATPVLSSGPRDELLQLQFTTGGATVFEGIERVLPGETLVIENARIIERHQTRALPDEAPVMRGATDALAELDRVLNDSVGIHQRSDVPYGMFLSGGVDSSVLLAMMARLNERPVRAYTAGFPGTSAQDERDHARMVAKATRADHVEVAFDETDFWNLLPEIAAAMDDPAADYAILPTYKLARAVHADGLKVVLSGEGGDELFAGYGRYRAAARGWPLAKPMRRKGIFDGLGVLRNPDKARSWRVGIAASERTYDLPALTRLQMMQAVDCADWLPHDLLGKLDRCLMAHGVEGRVPFLDQRVAEFAYRLPDSLKLKRGLGKWILRRWLETGLPVSKPFARKRGFTVPVGEWIGSRGAQLGALVAAQPGIAEVCQADAVEKLFAAGGKKQGKAAWTLLFYALWHRKHILGMAPVGDVFDSLAEQ